MVKRPVIRHIKSLDNADLSHISDLMSCCDVLSIEKINWPETANYKPSATVRLAYSPKALYLLFVARTDCMKAAYTIDQSPVCKDDCVEFFMQLPGCVEYWNFEFNCIGTLNASHRERRDTPSRLSKEELNQIERWASAGKSPIDMQHTEQEWSLGIRIPLTLIGISDCELPEYILGNFYKCGDETSHPHYLSWKPVNTTRPNFHHIADFSPIFFEK